MADGNGGGGATSVLTFILGGVLVLLAIGAFFIYGGHFGAPNTTTHNINLNVTAPKKPG